MKINPRKNLRNRWTRSQSAPPPPRRCWTPRRTPRSTRSSARSRLMPPSRLLMIKCSCHPPGCWWSSALCMRSQLIRDTWPNKATAPPWVGTMANYTCSAQLMKCCLACRNCSDKRHTIAIWFSKIIPIPSQTTPHKYLSSAPTIPEESSNAEQRSAKKSKAPPPPQKRPLRWPTQIL